LIGGLNTVGDGGIGAVHDEQRGVGTRRPFERSKWAVEIGLAAA
jgi:hypothetical protein